MGTGAVGPAVGPDIRKSALCVTPTACAQVPDGASSRSHTEAMIRRAGIYQRFRGRAGRAGRSAAAMFTVPMGVWQVLSRERRVPPVITRERQGLRLLTQTGCPASAPETAPASTGWVEHP